MEQETALTQEILNRLDALAESLGTTVEYLWPTLVAKEAALGWSSILIGLLCLVAAWPCTKGLVFAAKKYDGGEGDEYAGLATFLVFALIVLVIASGAHLFDADTYARIAAPEAYALKAVLP